MRLTIDEIIEFQTKGLLIAKNALTKEDLQPMIDEISAIIDARAQALYAEGKITELHADETFERRYVLLFRQCAEIGKKMDIYELRGKEMYNFLNNKNLLDTVECLLGSEISCNPIQHLRAKMPPRPGEENNIALFERAAWHQDAGVTLEEADASEIITFWLPLVDVTDLTGCMHIIPDVFKAGYIKHYTADVNGTTIVDELLPQTKPIVAECNRGDIIIMNKYTPHCSFINRSDIVRWSLDLRFHKTGNASGRPAYPSFVVRSRANPESELNDHAEWSRLWESALQTKIDRIHRV